MDDNDNIPDLISLENGANSSNEDEIEADLLDLDSVESENESVLLDGSQSLADSESEDVPPASAPRRQQRAYVLVPPSRFKKRLTRVPVPPPADGIPVDLPGRYPDLPKIYRLKTHPLAPEGHSGGIFLAYVDYTLGAINALFKKAANMPLPTSRTEMEAQGKIMLMPGIM